MTFTLVVFRIVAVFVLALGVAVVTSTAQVAPPQTTTFALPPAPDAAALEARDLAWIKTGNDFDQKGLTAELIDKEIENRIKAYGRETAIVTFDVPLNSQRFFKPQREQTYENFDASIGNINDKLPQNKAYFWRYRDIDIAVAGDTYQDQLNVYAVARALEIIRCRYPKAYQKLFLETRTFASQAPKKGFFVNRLKNVLIAFHTITTTADIAESGQALGNNEDMNGDHGKYSNLAVITIHAKNILGSETFGSSVLYKKTPNENYIRYLREGIVETLVHEMLHRYINTRAHIDNLETIIFEARPPKNGTARPLNDKWEEVFIINTSLAYFTREGGLEPSVPAYYRNVLEGNINLLKQQRSARIFDDMSRLSNFDGNNYTEIMRLKVLD